MKLIIIGPDTFLGVIGEAYTAITGEEAVMKNCISTLELMLEQTLSMLSNFRAYKDIDYLDLIKILLDGTDSDFDNEVLMSVYSSYLCPLMCKIDKSIAEIVGGYRTWDLWTFSLSENYCKFYCLGDYRIRSWEIDSQAKSEDEVYGREEEIYLHSLQYPRGKVISR